MYVSASLVTMALLVNYIWQQHWVVCFLSSSDLSCSVCEGKLERRVTEKERGTGEGGEAWREQLCMCVPHWLLWPYWLLYMATALGCLFPSSSDLSCSVCEGS